MSIPRRVAFHVPFVVAVTIASACGGDDGGTDPPPTGAIEVAAATTGDDVDPDGYAVTVGTTVESLGINGSVTVGGLTPGDFDVEITDVAANCSAAGANPRAITVSAGATAATTFDVTCALATGSVEVTTSTTGSTLDPDGYTITVDGGAGQSIATNGSSTFTGVTAGPRQVELTDLASNCTVSGSNPRTVTVAAGGTASTSFDVACTFALRNRIAFQTVRDGNSEVYFMDPDGSSPTNLTNDPGLDSSPAVSPDGTRIAFQSSRDGEPEIWVMDADGSNQTNLTGGERGFDPEWSPDGSRIAFSTDRDGDFEVYVMDADGSNPVNLTNDTAFDVDAAWSPDGSRIAFQSDRDGNVEIHVMDADGSNTENLTNDPGSDFNPAWSPDGAQIVFDSSRDGDFEVYVMDADGSNQTSLTNDAGGSDPTWSPDGGHISFVSDRDGGEFDIYAMDADGSNPTNLTNDSANNDQSPDWSPE